MENSERLSETKEVKEATELLEKYFKLQAQIDNPTRFGMIDALSDAQKIAGQEISMLERSQGETCPTPWANIPDDYLYRKLAQYQQGLYNYAVSKLGEAAFKKLLEKYLKASANQ